MTGKPAALGGPTEAESVRGVNLMKVRDGLIVEGMGYMKG